MSKRYDVGSMVISICLALCGLFAWFYAGEFSALGGIFPKTFAIVLIICSLGYVAACFVKGGSGEVKARGSEQFWRGGALFVVLLLWCLLLGKAGFLVTSVISYVILAVLADHDHAVSVKRILIHSGLGLVIAVIFYIGFSQFLGVPLPKGILPF